MHHLPDLAQQMSCRDACLQVDIVEQRPARLVRLAHHHSRSCRPKGESCSVNGVEGRLLQHPARLGPGALTGC
ncbi:hypothetical protein J2X53_004498 [Pseudorhodobacter sp. 4114]|nr:hypothetical protein [Pseudorhodobacter sp. 4114]